MTSWLALIESNTSGTGRLFARAAREQGYQPVLLTADPARYTYVAEESLDFVIVDSENRNAIADECRRLESDSGLAGVTSSSEYFIETAAIVARELNLPGPNPVAVRLCRDKYRQRKVLHKAGVGGPKFGSAATRPEAIRIATSIGFPVVIKTVGGSGSVGVRLCANESEVVFHASQLLQIRQNERGQRVPRRILVESLLDGPEFSVELFSGNVVGITRKHLGPLPFFVESGHDFPATLDHEADEAIRRSSSQAVAALGLNWGPAHLELRLSTTGPRIVEVNPRLAGGFIPELVRQSTGVDMIDQTIRLVAGGPPDLSASLHRYSSIRFVIPEREGDLSGVDGVEEARSLSHVTDVRLYVDPPSKITLRGDFRDRIGHVIACADNSVDAARAVESACAKIGLVVT